MTDFDRWGERGLRTQIEFQFQGLTKGYGPLKQSFYSPPK